MFEDLDDFVQPETRNIKMKVKKILIENPEGHEIEIIEPTEVHLSFTQEPHPGDIFNGWYITEGYVKFKTVKKLTYKRREE